jgi:polyphosphate kinase
MRPATPGYISRSSCGYLRLIPGVPGMSENIEAISIVDRYLEHSRIFIFSNGGDPLYFISSADWMAPNLDTRIEISCPISDRFLQKELLDILEIQWSDNVKSRVLNALRTTPTAPLPHLSRCALKRRYTNTSRSKDR